MMIPIKDNIKLLLVKDLERKHFKLDRLIRNIRILFRNIQFVIFQDESALKNHKKIKNSSNFLVVQCVYKKSIYTGR